MHRRKFLFVLLVGLIVAVSKTALADDTATTTSTDSPTAVETMADTVTASPSATPSAASTATPTPSTTIILPTRAATRTPTATFNLTPHFDFTFTASPTVTATVTNTFVPITSGNGVGLCWADSSAPNNAYMYFGLALAPGGGVIVGGANATGQPLLRRFGTDGSNLWNAGVPPKNGNGVSGMGTIRSLAVGANGDIYVGGNANMPQCSSAAFLQRYSATGAWVWDAQYCGMVDADSVSISGDGRLGACGFGASPNPQYVSLLQYDLNGTLQWSRTIPTYGVGLDSVYDTCGRFWATVWDNNGANSGLVAFSGDGSQQGGIALPNYPVAAVTTATDGTILEADGDRIHDLRSDGTVLWTSTAVALNQIWCVATDPSGNVYACGDNGTNVAAVKLSSSGAPLWTWIGPTGRAERMVIDDQSSVWITGDIQPDGPQGLLFKLCQAPLGAAVATAACQTFTSTPTATASPSSSVTVTPRPTATRTRVVSPTSSSTSSTTPTSSATGTGSPSATSTASGTATATSTDLPTGTLTPTDPATATPSGTCTQPPSPTTQDSFTTSPTDSFTDSPTPTFTATLTDVLTDTPTDTFTDSPTGTFTDSPSPTFTDTATDTFTDSPTGTFTDSPSPTFTDTPTDTFTDSPTGTFTDSPSPTFTGSPTSSFTVTPTNTFTASPTSSFTGSPTPSSTVSPTATCTASLTRTTLPSMTVTSTSSPTRSPSPTATRSFTRTASPTRTPTATRSPTRTASPTRTPTLTRTPTRTPTHGGVKFRPADPKGSQGFVVAPNPAWGHATVRFELKEEANVVLALYDLQGGMLRQWPLGDLPAGRQEHVVDLSGLAPGSYFAVLRSQGPGRSVFGLFKLALRP
jgi:hypothetical protein